MLLIHSILDGVIGKKGEVVSSALRQTRGAPSSAIPVLCTWNFKQQSTNSFTSKEFIAAISPHPVPGRCSISNGGARSPPVSKHQRAYPHATFIVAVYFNNTSLKKTLPNQCAFCSTRGPMLLLFHHQRCLSVHSSMTLCKIGAPGCAPFPSVSAATGKCCSIGEDCTELIRGGREATLHLLGIGKQSVQRTRMNMPRCLLNS